MLVSGAGCAGHTGESAGYDKPRSQGGTGRPATTIPLIVAPVDVKLNAVMLAPTIPAQGPARWNGECCAALRGLREAWPASRYSLSTIILFIVNFSVNTYFYTIVTRVQ